MAMKTCKDCGTEVSKSAKACPKCGKKLKHTGLRVVLAILVIVVGFGAIAGNTSSDTKTTGSSVVKTEEKMTLEKFNKIETGMTYQQVVDIAGEEGTLSTESAYGSQNMKIYYWYSSNGVSNATISFTNGKVSAKSQMGLK